MPLILHLPLYLEVNGEQVFHQLFRRWFFHAQSIWHAWQSDKLDQRGSNLTEETAEIHPYGL